MGSGIVQCSRAFAYLQQIIWALCKLQVKGEQNQLTVYQLTAKDARLFQNVAFRQRRVWLAVKMLSVFREKILKRSAPEAAQHNNCHFLLFRSVVSDGLASEQRAGSRGSGSPTQGGSPAKTILQRVLGLHSRDTRQPSTPDSLHGVLRRTAGWEGGG